MRLIDVDKLIQELEVDRQEMLAKYYEEDCDSYYGGVLSSVKEVVKNIKNKPTAYDVDAVVKQLEEMRNLYKRLSELKDRDHVKYIYKIEALNDAIEIVKGGGVDNA